MSLYGYPYSPRQRYTGTIVPDYIRDGGVQFTRLSEKARSSKNPPTAILFKSTHLKGGIFENLKNYCDQISKSSEAEAERILLPQELHSLGFAAMFLSRAVPPSARNAAQETGGDVEAPRLITFGKHPDHKYTTSFVALAQPTAWSDSETLRRTLEQPEPLGIDELKVIISSRLACLPETPTAGQLL